MMANNCTVARRLTNYGIALLMALAGTHAHASSFALIEQSVSGMGTAYASGSAGLDDASTIFFNPATMSRLSGSNLTGGLQIINSNTDFKGDAIYNPALPPGIGGESIAGKNKDDLGELAAVPMGAISYQHDDQLWFGLTINTPFGLKTEYDSDWVGRYSAIKSELLTFNFNPTMAFKFNEKFTLGLGVSAMYADGELTRAADVGLGDFVGNVTATPPRPPNLPWFPDAVGTNTFDSQVKLTGDDWGFGYNIGLLFEPTDNARIGLHYRSKIDLTLDGDVKVSGPVVNSKQGAELGITLPDSLSLSGYFALNPQWALRGDITWTKWDRIQSLDIKLDDGSESIAVWNYDNSTRYSVGTEYIHNPSWTFRGGLALDETPVPSDSLRSVRVPDADRTWLTFGATYNHSKSLTFDFGYAHLFVDDPKLDNVPDDDGAHLVSGEYDSAVDIFGAQVNWRFN
jgi:long-chain fatty acid transport protein